MLGGCASSSGIQASGQLIAPNTLGLDAAGAEYGQSSIPAQWWQSLGDPALNELVERALANNPSLMTTQARLVKANAAIAGMQAADGPQVNGALDITRQRFSANSIYPPPLGGSTLTLGTAQLGASWEFDFFGRNHAAIEAAIGMQRAVQADIQAARILLASNVVRSYIQLARLAEQREISLRTFKQREELLSLITQRVQSGLDTNVELRQGQGALPETRLQVEQLDEQIMLARNALAALTSQVPAALDGLKPSLDKVQMAALPNALPADLLSRRADITAARWRIEAASSDMQSAKAQFYPNINLTAFLGLSSIGLSQLIKSSSEQYGVGPAIRLPIFDAGRLRANLSGKTADLDAAIASYNGAVLDAVHDAADQIGSLSAIDRQQTAQKTAQAAAESAYDLAKQRFNAGLSTYLVVLNTEAAVLNQRRLAADLKARSLEVHVALIRALGGGYTADAQLALHSTPATKTIN